MSALTVLGVKTRVKRKFGDEAGVQLTDDDILRFINDAQRRIVSRNDSLLEKTATANSVVGQQEYTLPTDLLKFKSMSYKGSTGTSYQQMQGYTLNELNLYVSDWDASTVNSGIPVVYAIHAGKFVVYPIPNEAVTAAFKIYYCRKPTDMILDADTLDLPELYHDTVVDLVLQDAYEMDEDWPAASAKSAQTNQNIDRLKDSDEWTKRDTYPVITVRPEDL